MDKARYYIVAGTGNASANVIETGLNDVALTAGEFVILWTGKPTDGQARVLDWLLEHSSSFTVFYSDAKVHHAVEGAANRVVQVNDLIEDSLDIYPNASVLVLWDEVSAEPGQPTKFVEDLVLSANKKGMETLDLCNGLVPLVVGEVDVDEPAEAPRKPQDALKKATPSPTQDLPLNASNDLYTLSYVKDGRLKSFSGPKKAILNFLDSE